MVITKENDEIVIRIPTSETDLSIQELQDLLDYILYRRLVAKSEATQDEIDELAREVNKNWWEENKERFLGT